MGSEYVCEVHELFCSQPFGTINFTFPVPGVLRILVIGSVWPTTGHQRKVSQTVMDLPTTSLCQFLLTPGISIAP